VKDRDKRIPASHRSAPEDSYAGGMGMSRERALAEAFVEAADTLVDDFDVIDFLHTLAERCVQLLDVDAAGLMLADQRGTLHASAASSENARLMELFELQADVGPCVDCYRTGARVVNADLDANAERWPLFAEAARAGGFVSVHALPLAQRGLQQADLIATQLQNALNSRITIEQAKGALAERHMISVDEAFVLLRRHARGNNLRISDLARNVANGAPLASPAPTAAVPADSADGGV